MNKLGTLNTVPIIGHEDLVAVSTLNTIKSLNNPPDIEVAEIDPTFSDTAAFCEHYRVSLKQTVNCVIIKAIRGDKNWYAACLIFGDTKADVNGLVRRHLGARKASFAPMDEAVALTQMEYGGITPVGLPNDWPILVDKAVADSEQIVIGSGIRKSKIVLSGKALMTLPNVTVLEGLGVVKTENSDRN